MNNVLVAADLEITASAAQKMNELFSQVEDDIAAIRVYAQPGGCSGVSFGMPKVESVIEIHRMYEDEPEVIDLPIGGPTGKTALQFR